MSRALPLALAAALIAAGCGRDDFGSGASTDEVVDSDVDRESPGSDNSVNNTAPEQGSMNNTTGGEAGANNAYGGWENNGGAGAPPDVDEVGWELAVDISSDIAFEAYHALAAGPGDVVIGAHGLSRGLALAYAAAGAAADPALQALFAAAPGDDALHASFNTLDLELQARAGADRLGLASGIWVQDGEAIPDDFVDLAARYYGLQVRLADFALQPADARNRVNNWTRDATDGYIVDVAPPRSITEETRFLLTDGAYFAASWQTAFDPARTALASFHGRSGVVEVEMMRRIGALLYHEATTHQAASLAFEEGFALTVVLPAEGRFDEVEAGFDADFLRTTRAAMAPVTVDLGLPRGALAGRFLLSEQAEAMGLVGALTGTHPLVLSDLLQRTSIFVDEAGLQASPDTTDTDTDTDGTEHSNSVSLMVDRPFLFAITDTRTGAILYLGRWVEG